MAVQKKQSLPLLEPYLVKAFDLVTLYKPTPLLSEWIEATGEISEYENFLLTEVHRKLIRHMNHWNEEELKMQFISMITLLAYFDDAINTYYDREISETIGAHFLLCKSDMMLSKGIGELIESPYFFMHEYKREKKYSGDPIGQMLGGMLIGQAKNQNGKPMYGCYVQGRFWFFCILEGKEYVISKSFDASEMDEAKQIIYILRKMNTIILERLMD
jgi:hypothetical protein